MDWRPLVHPVGSLPRSVYWLRRGAVLLVIVFVVAAIGVLAGHLGGGARPASVTASTRPPAKATTTGQPATGSSTIPSPVTSSTAPAGGTCSASALVVSVKTTDPSVAAGADVHIVATLSTNGADCSAVGPLSVVITSGSDRVWGSTDCSPASTTTTTALADHGSASATRTWDLTRSKPGCATVVGDKTANAGHYRVTATWAGATSAPYDFTLG
ncbi:MAG TPA: hypothetical protein VIJ71_06555 [Mycobacteriales bacterium]